MTKNRIFKSDHRFQIKIQLYGAAKQVGGFYFQYAISFQVTDSGSGLTFTTTPAECRHRRLLLRPGPILIARAHTHTHTLSKRYCCNQRLVVYRVIYNSLISTR